MAFHLNPKQENCKSGSLEGTAGLSATTGGIESDDSWDDDVEEMDFSETSEETDEVESTIVSADDLYGDDSDMGELFGMEISGLRPQGRSIGNVGR